MFFIPQKQAFATCGVYNLNSCPANYYYCSGSGQGLARRVTCCTIEAECAAQPSTYLTSGVSPSPTVLTTSNTCSLLTGNSKTACEGCMDDGKSVWTAIGCVEATSTGLLNKFLPFAIGIAGGIAFLLILFGALQMMMSAGNPEKLNAGKELVTAAITGLLLIIFSVFILRLVGVTILKIPGFE